MSLDLTAIGWFHAVLGVYALVAGARVLVAMKGDSHHRKLGRRYALATVLVSLSGLGIYRQGTMSAFHLMALATLVGIALAVVAARRQGSSRMWLRTHLTAILFSYYMLLGGTVNQAFARIPLLTSLSRNAMGIALGMTHSVLIALFLMVVAYFWGKTSHGEPIRFSQALPAKALAALAVIVIGMPWAGDVSAATVEVVVRDVHGDTGDVYLQLCTQDEYLKTRCSFQAKLPARNGDILFRFANVSPGYWAATSFHDENRNGKLDANAIGIPTEGYGFSRDAIGWFGAPKFDDARFEVKEETTKQDLRIKY